MKAYFKDIKKNLTVINENDKNSCEGKIKIQNVEEIKNAVFTMKLNKSSGLDGLPIECYRTFLNEIGDLLFK